MDGDQGTVAAHNIKSYLSAIGKFILDHGKPPVMMGQKVCGVHKDLAT